MPADFTTFRAQCGSFYSTYIDFMTKRAYVFRSLYKFVRLVPRHCDFHSANGLHFRTDCSLFYFSYVSYTYDEKFTYRKARFGSVTAVCVAVFLARLLLLCMDVERNPGPGVMDTRFEEAKVQLAGGFGAPPSFSSNQCDGIIKTFSTCPTTGQYPSPQNPAAGTATGMTTSQHPNSQYPTIGTSTGMITDQDLQPRCPSGGTATGAYTLHKSYPQNPSASMTTERITRTSYQNFGIGTSTTMTIGQYPYPQSRILPDGIMVGLLLSLLYFGILLHRCGDIELNPGPPKTDNLRQTRLMSGSASRTSSAERRETWDNNGQTTRVVTGEKSGAEPTLRDVMSMLSNMNTKFDGMKDDLKDMRESFFGLKEEVQELRDEISDLRRVNEDLKSDNVNLRKRMADIERQTDDLECRSKRNNLIIYGLPRVENETWHECEEVVQELLTDKLEMHESPQFDRVHRLSAKPNSPIVARCTFYKDKETIMKAKTKLKGSNVFISEDFSLRVREIRKKLLPHLKAAKDEKKKATMVYDHLLINGKKFILNEGNSLQQKE